MKKMKINLSVEFNGVNLPFLKEEIFLIGENMLNFAFENSFFSEKFNNFKIEDFTYNIDLLFCNNEFIKDINKKYRNIDSATDVITFALFSDMGENIIVDDIINLGQIIISVEKASSQADEYNLSLKDELLNLVSHGILHILGIDHNSEESLNLMLDMQKKMIKAVYNVKI